jgi:UDP-2,3-diacylglucosamine pyrophosphatase LpxH
VLAGRSLRTAAAECNVSTAVIQRVMSEIGAAQDEQRIRAVVEAMLRQMATPVELPAIKPEVVEQAPVKFAANPRSRAVDLGRSFERIAVISDLHHPFQDDVAIDCALAAIRDFDPQFLVLLGDYFDCYPISDHDQEPGRADYLQDEFDAAQPTHRKINEATPRAKKVFVEGNHCHRIRRLQARNPGLFKLRSLELPIAADLPKDWMCYPNQTRFKAGSLTLLHGDTRGRGTSSKHAAAGMLDKLRTSCLFGHLHRFQAFHETAEDGSIRGAFANGHLCDVSKADYITNPDWQQGFSTIEFDWSAGIFSVTPHLIVRGCHRWNGKTYGTGQGVIA